MEKVVGIFVPFEHLVPFFLAKGFRDATGLRGNWMNGAATSDFDTVLTNLAEANDFLDKVGVLFEKGNHMAC